MVDLDQLGWGAVMSRIPRWVWWVIGVVVVLVVVVLLKVNLQIGSAGLHVTQGLVH